MPTIPSGTPLFQMPNGLIPNFTRGLISWISALTWATNKLTLSRRQSATLVKPRGSAAKVAASSVVIPS